VVAVKAISLPRLWRSETLGEYGSLMPALPEAATLDDQLAWLTAAAGTDSGLRMELWNAGSSTWVVAVEGKPTEPLNFRESTLYLRGLVDGAGRALRRRVAFALDKAADHAEARGDLGGSARLRALANDQLKRKANS
jgi:hypothetical protein